ncbi:hypothetical protein [Jatrophihabitans fulvus]
MTQPDTRPPNVIHGGDKLAFVIPGAVKQTPLGLKAAGTITLLRDSKRAVKKRLEDDKEAKLTKHDHIEKAIRHAKRLLVANGKTKDPLAAEVLKAYLTSKDQTWKDHVAPTDHRKFLELFTKLTAEERKILDGLSVTEDKVREEERKKILREFDAQVGKTAGWNLDEVAASLRKLGLNCDGTLDARADARYEFVGDVDGETRTVVRVYTGAMKYKPSDEDPERLLRTRGSRIQPTTEGEAKRDDPRKQYVKDHHGTPTRRYVTRAINFYHLASMFGFKFEKEVWTSGHKEGQFPRATTRTLKEMQGTFRTGNAAVTDPSKWASTYGESTETHVPGMKSGEERKSGAMYSGPNATNVVSTANDPSRELSLDEQASMQVRDGSGERQQMLSATAAQEGTSGKERAVIRGNKGERFDIGPETVAVVEIDLRELLKKELAVLNQHSVDSQQYKIAFDRWVAVKEDNKVPTEIKRQAFDELAEYVYSARKNREVVVSEIPNSALTRIQISGTKKWGEVGPPLAPKQWHKWADAEQALREFIQDLKRLNAMRDRAVPKMAERESRT